MFVGLGGGARNLGGGIRGWYRFGRQAASVIAHDEPELARLDAQGELDFARGGVFDDVIEHFP